MLRLPKLTFKAKVLKVLNNSAIKKREQTNSTTTGGDETFGTPYFYARRPTILPRSEYCSQAHTATVNRHGSPFHSLLHLLLINSQGCSPAWRTAPVIFPIRPTV